MSTADIPPDHVADDDGLDPSVGGELKSATEVAERVDPDRRAGLDVLDEDLVARVLVHPQHTVVEEDGELRVPVHVLLLDGGDDFEIGGHKSSFSVSRFSSSGACRYKELNLSAINSVA